MARKIAIDGRLDTAATQLALVYLETSHHENKIYWQDWIWEPQRALHQICGDRFVFSLTKPLLRMLLIITNDCRYGEFEKDARAIVRNLGIGNAQKEQNMLRQHCEHFRALIDDGIKKHIENWVTQVNAKDSLWSIFDGSQSEGYVVHGYVFNVVLFPSAVCTLFLVIKKCFTHHHH